MKVLVTGAGGQVAWELEQTCPAKVDLFSFSSKELDVTNKFQVHEIVSKVNPDVLINAAAYTAVDKAESEPEQAFLVNAEGPGNLAEVCNEIGARLIHISTDFVFDGAKKTPYTVSDMPNPLNVYGRSKLEGEKRVLANIENSLVIRTSWVYSTHGKNFVKTMLRLMAQEKKIRVVSDQVGSPTYAKSLAKFIWDLSETNITGIENFSNLGETSWFDFASEIKQKMNLHGLPVKCEKIDRISCADYEVSATRPIYSVLDLRYVSQTTEWKMALESFFKDYKNSLALNIDD